MVYKHKQVVRKGLRTRGYIKISFKTFFCSIRRQPLLSKATTKVYRKKVVILRVKTYMARGNLNALFINMLGEFFNLKLVLIASCVFLCIL